LSLNFQNSYVSKNALAGFIAEVAHTLNSLYAYLKKHQSAFYSKIIPYIISSFFKATTQYAEVFLAYRINMKNLIHPVILPAQ
jgi:hypothetical protein